MSLPWNPNLERYWSSFPPLLENVSWGTGAVTVLLILYATKQLLLFYEYPILSPFEIFWNSFVYIMPCGLVNVLRPRAHNVQNIRHISHIRNDSVSHAEKSDVLRNAFGLGGGRAKSKHPQIMSPRGLGNWDNSCYQNSILQALASIPTLRTFLDKVDKTLDGTPKSTTLSALEEVTRQVNDSFEERNVIWTPAKLKSMSSWQQQDAQEYFSKVMDEMDKELVAEIRGREIPVRTTSRAKLTDVPVQLCSPDPISGIVQKHEVVSSIDLPRSMQNPFEGLLAQRVGCIRCGHTDGLSLIPFNCITLPLGHESEHTIQECLDEYTRLELIEGVECLKCTLLLAKHLCIKSLKTRNESSLDDDKTNSEHAIAAKQEAMERRLQHIEEALEDEDFSDETLQNRCGIPAKLKVTTTKSKQVIVMRMPKCLVMHVNRSLFDEMTGDQMKNYADVVYPKILDMSLWSVGSNSERNVENSSAEEWEMDPSKSMIPRQDQSAISSTSQYRVRAVVTHYGRHENGHYICYRQLPAADLDQMETDIANDGKDRNLDEVSRQWWRLSDENVTPVTEEDALCQGGAFMLFYERIDQEDPIAKSTKSLNAIDTKTTLEPRSDPALVGASQTKHEANDLKTNEGLEGVLATGQIPSAPKVQYGDRFLGQDADNSAHGLELLTRQDQAMSQVMSTNRRSPFIMRTAGDDWNDENQSPFKSLRMTATS